MSAHLRILTLSLATLVAASALSAKSAEAAPLPTLTAAKPKLRIVPRARAAGGSVRLSLTAELTIAGKTKRLSIFDMALKKTRKTMVVNRKVGKLYVSLKISWEGARTLAISGTARYLKSSCPYREFGFAFSHQSAGSLSCRIGLPGLDSPIDPQPRPPGGAAFVLGPRRRKPGRFAVDSRRFHRSKVF